MIPLDGLIKNAEIKGVASPYGGGLGVTVSGTIKIKAELATQSKEKVEVEITLGVLATKKILRKIGTSDNVKSLIGKRIEMVIE